MFAMSLPMLEAGLDLSIAEARRFALGRIESVISNDPDVAASFWDELDNATPSPDIIVVYCLLRIERATFTLLEFVSGQTLDQLCSHADPSLYEQSIPLFSRLLDACDANALDRAPESPTKFASEPVGGLQLGCFGICRASGGAPERLCGTIMVRPDGTWSEEILSEKSGRSATYPLLTAVYQELSGGAPAGSSLIPAQIESFSNRLLIDPGSPALVLRSLPYLTAAGAGALLIVSLFGLGHVLAKQIESRQVTGLQLPPAPPIPAPPTEASPIEVTPVETVVIKRGPEGRRAAVRHAVFSVVKLEVTIAEDGSVRDAKVLSGSPELARDAVDEVRKWIYQPAMVNGMPFPATTEVEFRFNLERPD
jgi:TonB family protein